MCLIFLLWVLRAGVGGSSSDLGIVGGNVTDITKVPYQAALLVNGDLLCGGSVISHDFILSAGHCCGRARNETVQVRLGSNEYYENGSVVDVRTLHRHPKFVTSSHAYDACLLRVTSPIEFGERIKPVTVAEVEPPAGDSSLVAGWGVTFSGNVEPSKVLMSVDVRVVNRTYCRKAYGNLPHFETFLCAGDVGKDACYGDSGGGLIWEGQLVGIVSFGMGCGLKGYPGVYASVANPEIRKFIKDIAGV